MSRRLVAVLNALTAAALGFLAVRILLAAKPSIGILALAGGLALLGALAVVASIGIWRGTRLGAVLTLLIQGSQLLQLETTSLTYRTSLPIAWVVGLGADLHLHWLAAWRPGLEITPDNYRPLPWIGANLPALAAVIVAGLALRKRPHAG